MCVCVCVCCLLSWLFPDGDLEWSQFRRVKFIKWWLQRNGNPEFETHNPVRFQVQQLHLFLISVYISLCKHSPLMLAMQSGFSLSSFCKCVPIITDASNCNFISLLLASLLTDFQEHTRNVICRQWKGYHRESMLGYSLVIGRFLNRVRTNLFCGEMLVV